MERYVCGILVLAEIQLAQLICLPCGYLANCSAPPLNDNHYKYLSEGVTNGRAQ